MAHLPNLPAEGYPAGVNVKVTDVLGPDLAFSTTHKARIFQTTELAPNQNGYEAPVWTGNYVEVDVPPSGVIEFTIEEDGTYIRVDFYTTYTGGVIGDTYTNHVRWEVEGFETSTADGTHVRIGGSGTGVGANVGRFQVFKEVIGTAEVDPSLEFIINYVVTTPSGDVIEDSGTLTAGGIFQSPEYPRDSIVTISEVTPVDSESVTWETPAFSVGDTFTLMGGQWVYITLTNEANLNTAPFSAHKVLTGDGVDLVDPDAVFTVHYSYPSGDGYPAGEGTLELPATGDVVYSDELPLGAVLTLTEAQPDEIAGGTWGESTLSPSTITVGADQATHVTVTNPITRDLGSFSVTKSLSGDGVSVVPDGTLFTVHWSHPAGDGFDADEGSLEVAAGETATVDGLPANAVVTLTEIAADGVEGGRWGEPVFDLATFTIQLGETIAVNLDNPITLSTGQFSIMKLIDGTGAALVDENTEFIVHYSYPATDSYPAGEGELTVRADGTVVTSEPLPYGAVVTLTEATPADIEGAEWVGAEFSTNEIVIGDTTTIEVTLTNTITEVPEEPVPTDPDTEITTPEPPAPPLTTTGSDVSTVIVSSVAASLMLVGAVLLLVQRRRSQVSSA